MRNILQCNHFSHRLTTLLSLGFLLGLQASAQQGDENSPTAILSSSGSGGATNSAVQITAGSNVYVSVREASGLPISQTALVKLACPLANVNLSRPAKDDGPVAHFFSVPFGDCRVEVSAAGYKLAKESVEVLQSVTHRNQYVFVYLHPDSELAGPVARPAVVPGKALKEIDKGMTLMQKKKDSEALAHLNKAAAYAPTNPDVAYLMGMISLDEHNTSAAALHFQRAVAYAPTNERALLGLGYTEVQTNQWPAAVQSLEKVLQLDSNSARAHLLLANAYAQLRNYPKAQEHAQRADELSPEDAAPARTLTGEILAAEGNRDGAKLQFEAVVRDFPNAPSTALAKEGLAHLADPASNTISTVGTSGAVGPPVSGTASAANRAALLPSMEAAKVTAWAPPNVDTAAPGVASDVVCSAEEVVERTSASTERQLDSLEKFLATEHIQHEEVNAKGEVSQLRDKNFQYMVFVEHAKDGLVFLDERRDGGANTDAFPTSLATVGLVSLGVDVFHPGFAKALDFKCEGLGQWRGKAAWVMHFAQKPGVKSYLRLWETQTKTIEVPLKGRVWVAAGSYNVLHVESDLREPMPQLELTRDHLAIDYGPVTFDNGGSELWLPWYADMYLELHGKRYHHSHTLTNFSLFSVNTNNTISAPKNVPPTDEDEPKKP
jgi:tetratricopeptide (TPR) repeat protein